MCPETHWIVRFVGPEPVWIGWQREVTGRATPIWVSYDALPLNTATGCTLRGAYWAQSVLLLVLNLYTILWVDSMISSSYYTQFTDCSVWRPKRMTILLITPCLCHSLEVQYFILLFKSIGQSRWPIQVATRSRTLLCRCSITGIASSNRAGGMDIRLLW
jgi:hypothetical protein